MQHVLQLTRTHQLHVALRRARLEMHRVILVNTLIRSTIDHHRKHMHESAPVKRLGDGPPTSSTTAVMKWWGCSRSRNRQGRTRNRLQPKAGILAAPFQKARSL